MLKINNRIWVFATVALSFWLSLMLVPLDSLIIVLNGLYVGSMVGVVVAYVNLAIDTFRKPYDRTKHMSIGFFLCWVAYAMSTGNSISFRAMGADVTPYVMTAAHRVVAIVGAAYQITAPDYGFGMLHGTERKTLVISLILGAIAAALVIYAQFETVFIGGSFN